MRIRRTASRVVRKSRLAPGFVLPMAATISLVIALLVGGALEFVTAKTQDMARIRDHAQALTVLRSAQEQLILLLLGSDRSGVDATWQDNLGEQLLGLKENRIFFDGTPVVFSLQGRQISARVLDESGLAGLNALTVDEQADISVKGDTLVAHRVVRLRTHGAGVTRTLDLGVLKMPIPAIPASP